MEGVNIEIDSRIKKSAKKDIFKNHEKEKMYDELTLENLNNIYNHLLTSSEEKQTTLLIMDDIGASLKNKEVQKLLRLIIYNRRHLKTHIVMLLQSYLSCPKEIRKLLSNAILFKPSKVEMENFFNELFEMKQDEAIDLMNYAYKNKHDYLFLNIENQKIYQEFDEIIINQEDNNI